MKWARVELLALALWLAPAAAAPEQAPDLELLEFLADDDEVQEAADADFSDEAELPPGEPPRHPRSRSEDHEDPDQP